jgi:hypothetical protein
MMLLHRCAAALLTALLIVPAARSGNANDPDGRTHANTAGDRMSRVDGPADAKHGRPAIPSMVDRTDDADALDATTAAAQVPRGIARVPIDFDAFPGLFRFDGRRVYVARWGCHHDEKTTGVGLDVLDRRTLVRTVRVALLDCDDAQQDSIKSIVIVHNMIVLGIEYRFEEAGRPNVMIVNKRTLRPMAKLFLPLGITGLSSWKGRLLACEQGPGRTHQRFDRASARLVEASASESRACRDGDTVALAPARAFLDNADDFPAGRTQCCDVVGTYSPGGSDYRVVDRKTGLVRRVGPPHARYSQVIVIQARDALLLRYSSEARTRLAYYSIEHDSTVDLLELNMTTRPDYAVVWSHFAFIARGRDLLVYDLDQRKLVHNENELIREGFMNNCCGMDRNGIVRLVLDQGRLLVLTADGANSRLIDLRAYTSRLPASVLFEAGDN